MNEKIGKCFRKLLPKVWALVYDRWIENSGWDSGLSLCGLFTYLINRMPQKPDMRHCRSLTRRRPTSSLSRASASVSDSPLSFARPIFDESVAICTSRFLTSFLRLSISRVRRLIDESYKGRTDSLVNRAPITEDHNILLIPNSHCTGRVSLRLMGTNCTTRVSLESVGTRCTARVLTVIAGLPLYYVIPTVMPGWGCIASFLLLQN